MIDPELVARKMVLIAKDLAALQTLGAKSASAFLADEFAERLAERYLERMIGRMIDINYHLATESGQPPPVDYYQSFLELAELGVTDGELARRLAPCAGLRNRIVHEYDELDPARIYEAVQFALDVVPEYLRRIETFLSTRQEERAE